MSCLKRTLSLTEAVSSSWAIRPLEVKDRLAQYLQGRIRYFVWANDSEMFYDRDHAQSSDKMGPAALENAVRLGHIDLNVLGQVIDQLKFPPQESIHTLLAAIKKTYELRQSQEPTEPYLKILQLCGTIDMPFAAVVTKHLGDLCADDDQWENALRFYRASLQWLDDEKTETWKGYIDLLRGIVAQSIAAALRPIKGPKIASAFLSSGLDTATLSVAPLFLLTRPTTPMWQNHRRPNRPLSVPDRRASILTEPLLLKSQDLSSAFVAWIEGEHLTAHRYFWSVLRRQIALGSASDARMTQTFYAKSVFSALEKTADRELNRSLFVMGVRLFLQGGEPSLAKKLSWNEKLVRVYVDADAVELAISQSNAVEASKDERLRRCRGTLSRLVFGASGGTRRTCHTDATLHRDRGREP